MYRPFLDFSSTRLDTWAVQLELFVTLRAAWILCKRAGADWHEDSIPRFGAALAFYMFFSLAPLLTTTISISGILYGQDEVERRIHGEIDDFAGPAAADAVQALVHGAWKTGPLSWGMGVGILAFFVAAMSVLNELQGGLHLIWRVHPRIGVSNRLLNQLKLAGFLLGMVLLLGISLCFDTAVAALVDANVGWMPWPRLAVHILDLVFEWMTAISIFAAVFKWLPDARIAWKDVWTGAAFTSGLFLGGKYLLEIYFGVRGIGSMYGVAGSLIIIMIWVYYSSFIFYFGAEFTKSYAISFGSHIRDR